MGCWDGVAGTYVSYQARGSEFDPWDPHGERREKTSLHWPLASIYMSWHMCTPYPPKYLIIIARNDLRSKQLGWGDRPLVECLPKERVCCWSWTRGNLRLCFCVCLGIFTLNHSNSSADARFNADCIKWFKLERVFESLHAYHSSIRGGRDRKIRSSRSFFLHNKLQATQGWLRPCFKN